MCKSLSLAGLVLLSTMSAWAQTPITIFGDAAPQNPVISDAAAVTLGVKFYSTQDGTIAGIRFYRGAANPRGYRVRLYSANGKVLASARGNDTCSVPCWEQIDFASPIPIKANTSYVAAYYTSDGDYAGDNGGLTDGASNPPLVAPASAQVGGNGVYTYSASFPRQTYLDSNYYVDVAFVPAAPPPATLMLSFSPPNPSIPADAAEGTMIVAAAIATWSDGSPFTGIYSFGPPHFDDGGVFMLKENQIFVNPNGPGLPTDGGIANITVVATQ